MKINSAERAGARKGAYVNISSLLHVQMAICILETAGSFSSGSAGARSSFS